MKTLRLMIMMVASLMLAGSYAQAGDYAVGVKVGTLGPSLEVTTNIVPMFLNARIQGNKYSTEFTSEGDGLTNNATLDLSSLALIADVYPFAGKFRLSAGAYLNGNTMSLVATPTGGTFNIGGFSAPAGSAAV
ncbi:MAG: hypothetical protein Q9M19_08860, partial [Mariprofundaceae bacterium]|nr:hypothetical protein [Mariprofundaceae bacterium]